MANPYIEEMAERPEDPLGGASGSHRRFTAQFIGKANSPEFPYTVANEVVASEIGRALGLPVPPVLVHAVGADVLVLSHRVGKDPRILEGPPATASLIEAYVRGHPKEVHGAIVFDLFVGNNDRAFGPERRNISIDQDGRLWLFDQGNALFYRQRPAAGIEAGVSRLTALEASLGALADMAHKGNLYLQLLTDWSLVREWGQRIEALPDFFFEAAVAQIPATLERPTRDERNRLVEFLVKRKRSLVDQIAGSPGMFPGLSLVGGGAA